MPFLKKPFYLPNFHSYFNDRNKLGMWMFKATKSFINFNFYFNFHLKILFLVNLNILYFSLTC